ncbi:lytic murein transglycosylase [Dongia deserti]|uniref:lytic murein transglycosylase n=1 Tax=Dongia deserti TaxID=2268030 RepID=UPI0013C440D9|nr:lytic murein transglycosylase [Dongia deserti]
MRTRDLRKPRLGDSITIIIVGAVVALAGCAAQPAKTPSGPAGDSAPSTAEAAAAPIDFRTFNETSCPNSAASYQEWVAKFQSYALSKGRREDVVQTAFLGVKENPEISDRAAKQPEFVTPVWTYLERAVSDDRVARGQLKYQENKALLTGIEHDYGVPREIVMGIWGIETDFGNNFGDANVFEALTNLGYRANRQSFACTELLAALDIVANNKVPASRMVGSWAGAMGHPQFLPSNYLTLAVDRDGSGVPDLWESLPDALASAANHLVDDGWQRNLPWGLEVKLPATFPYGEAELDLTQPISHWKKLGVTRMDGSALPDLPGGTSILLLAGHRGPAFLITENFKVILKYNYSTSYALSVAHLGDRVLGGRRFIGKWPVHERPLSLPEREEVQTLLLARGYDVGKVDGVLGLKSRKAAREFQKELGWPQDGFINKALLEELRRRKNV